MQEQSAVQKSLPKRIEALRLAKHLTWDGVAGLLEISPSMIYQVKRGERNLCDLVMLRLEEAEIEAGLLSIQDATFARLLRNPAAQIAEPLNNSSHDAFIKMRAECLMDIVDTYDSEQMQVLLDRVSSLAIADKQFGKVFGQLGELVAHLQLRKAQMQDSLGPKSGGKPKAKVK